MFLGAEQRIPFGPTEEIAEGDIGELKESPSLLGEHRDDRRGDQDGEASRDRQCAHDQAFAQHARSEILILANRSLAEQALANLVSNAIKYSAEGTEVGIEISTEGPLIRIAVADQGPGIAAKHLPRIFERFYRVDKARARTQGGTGLGLAIVKHIASIHGGQVEVTSQVSQGSRFSLLLPKAADDSGAHAVPEVKSQ